MPTWHVDVVASHSGQAHNRIIGKASGGEFAYQKYPDGWPGGPTGS